MSQRLNDAEYQAKRAALWAALKAGEDSGPAEAFDLDAFIAELNAEYEANTERS